MLGFDAGEGRSRGIAGVNGEAFVFQIEFDEIGDFRFVVYHKNRIRHRCMPSFLFFSIS